MPSTRGPGRRRLPVHVDCRYCKRTVDPRMHFERDGTCPLRYGPHGRGPDGTRDDPDYHPILSYELRTALVKGKNSHDSRQRDRKVSNG